MSTTQEDLFSFIVTTKEEKIRSLVQANPNWLLPLNSEGIVKSAYQVAKENHQVMVSNPKTKAHRLTKAKAIVDYLRDQSLLYCIEQPNNLFFNYLRRQEIDFSSAFANGTTPLTLKGEALAEGTTPVEYASSLGNEHFVTKANINNQSSVTEGIDLFGLLNEKQRIEARRGQARLDHQVAVANERERYVTEAGELLTNMVITTP